MHTRLFGTTNLSAALPPVDLICELLLAAQDRVHEPMILAFCYREDEVRRVFAHPRCMVGSDATALCPDGPLQGAVFHGAYTWAGWFFRHFVRDTGLLSPEAAVHRLTGRPAARVWKTGGRSARAPGPTWRCSTARPSANGARSPRPISLPGAWSTCWSTACPHSKTGRGPGRGAGRCCAGADEGRWHLRF